MEKVLKITDYGMDGQGIAHDESHTYFLQDVLLGEQVEIQNGKTKVLTKSKNRVKPICPYYFECGGCNLQCMNDQEQKNYKQTFVKNCLNKHKIEFDGQFLYFENNTMHYRNKISFATRNINGQNKIGLFKQKSHDLIEIEECLITNKLHKKLLQVFRQYITMDDVDCFCEQTQSGNLKNIVVRFVDDKTLVCVVGTKNVFPKSEELNKKLGAILKDFSLSFCFNKNPKTILSNNIKTCFGPEQFVVKKDELLLPRNIGSFVQINDETSAKIYDYVLSQTDKNGVVLDAYSGAGTMTAMLAKKSKIAIGIEQNKFASDASNILFETNNLKNAKCIHGKCEDVLPKLFDDKTRDLKNACCVLDPPRKGCDKQVLNAILTNDIKKIIYVSCDPFTLARDLSVLQSKYKIKSIALFDMFYQTSKVETVVVLQKNSA